MFRKRLYSGLRGLIPVLTLVLTGCAHTWPEDRPEDIGLSIEVRWDSFGDFWKARVHGSRGECAVWRGGDKVPVNLFLSRWEWDHLYQQLRESLFWRIEWQRENGAPDRPGAVIRVTWRSLEFEVRDSGSDRVRPEWRSRWHRVIAAVRKVVEPRIEEAKVRIPLWLDHGLLGKKVTIYFDGKKVLSRKVKPDDLTLTFSRLPFSYPIVIELEQARVTLQGRVDPRTAKGIRVVPKGGKWILEEIRSR